MLQRVGSTQEGNASFSLSGDYYNRELSGRTLAEGSGGDGSVVSQKVPHHPGTFPGWEPFMEPWPCVLSWQQQAAGRLHPPRLKMEVRARHRLDVNVTSVLLGRCDRCGFLAAPPTYAPSALNVPFCSHHLWCQEPCFIFPSCFGSFQSNTTPPRARGWLTTVRRRRSRPPSPQPHRPGWAHLWTPPTLDPVSSVYNLS